MASIWKDVRSPFFVACFTAIVGQRRAQLKRSTFTNDRKLARRIADELEEAAQGRRDREVITSLLDSISDPRRQLVNYAIRKSKPIQSMITLKNDSLCFSFPEIDEVIRRLTEQHINSTLRAIIAADRARAVEALRSFWGFRRATPAERRWPLARSML